MNHYFNEKAGGLTEAQICHVCDMSRPAVFRSQRCFLQEAFSSQAGRLINCFEGKESQGKVSEIVIFKQNKFKVVKRIMLT